MASTADDLRPAGPPAKRFARRGVLGAIGAALVQLVVPLRLRAAPGAATPPPARPAPATMPRGPLRPLAFPTTPRAFSREEITTLGHLVETILPATETPGARDAGVHWFLDDVASQVADTRTRLVKGLALADARAAALFNARYAELAQGQQDNVMAALAGGAADERAFYEWLRGRVIDAYYRSEMGLVGELHWVGHEFHTEFPGRCTHADPLEHARPSWPSSRTGGLEA